MVKKTIRDYFIDNINILIIVLPLLTLVFYGVLTNSILKQNQTRYIKKEIKRYKEEIKQTHKTQLKDKAKYIKSFIDYLEIENAKADKVSNKKFGNDIFSFIESVKSYKNGFMFIFKGNGDLVKHPCANSLFSKDQKNKDALLENFLKAEEVDKFIYYTETSCFKNEKLEKIAYVVKVEQLDWYVAINRNQSEINQLVNMRKRIWKEKLDREINNNIKLLLSMGILSFFLSLSLSLFINKLIKKYKQEVKQTQETMLFQSRLAQAGELLNMIAHQWRHPISKIAAITTNLRFDILTDSINLEKLDKKFDDIEKHTEFLSETIDDFKEFYKPKKVNEKVEMVSIINKGLSFLESSIDKKDINIIDNYSDNLQKLYLNQNEMIQVIMNIVQNAIDAYAHGGIIEIKTVKEKELFTILIRDEAGGIDNSIINKIFNERFTTKTSNGNSDGLGLGLYISRIIIEKHFGGKLEVNSDNRMTTFIISLNTGKGKTNEQQV